MFTCVDVPALSVTGEYDSNSCVHSSHCVPCEVRFPSCKGRPDGINAWSGRERTPYFVVCENERLVRQGKCTYEEDSHIVFDPIERACVRLWDGHTCIHCVDKWRFPIFLGLENSIPLPWDIYINEKAINVPPQKMINIIVKLNGTIWGSSRQSIPKYIVSPLIKPTFSTPHKIIKNSMFVTTDRIVE